MFRRKPKLVKLPQTQVEFDALSISFLEEHGFPLSEEYQAFFGAHIQSLPGDDDEFDGVALAKRMRRSRVNELAYYLIHPEKRPKPEETQQDEAVQEAHSRVE